MELTDIIVPCLTIFGDDYQITKRSNQKVQRDEVRMDAQGKKEIAHVDQSQTTLGLPNFCKIAAFCNE